MIETHQLPIPSIVTVFTNIITFYTKLQTYLIMNIQRIKLSTSNYETKHQNREMQKNQKESVRRRHELLSCMSTTFNQVTSLLGGITQMEEEDRDRVAKLRGDASDLDTAIHDALVRSTQLVNELV